MIKQKILVLCASLLIALTPVSAVALAEEYDTQYPKIMITEVQNHGDTATNEFIELYNPGTEAILLDGWSILYVNSSGNESVLLKLDSISILPGEFIIGTHESFKDLSIPNIATTFTYSGNGLAQVSGGIILKDTDGITVDELYWTKAVSQDTTVNAIGGLVTNYSAQRWCDESQVLQYSGIITIDFRIAAPTPGTITCDEAIDVLQPEDETIEVPIEPNDDNASQLDTQERIRFPVYINELFIDPEQPLSDSVDEFIELYNPNTQQVDISGYTITVGSTTRYSYTFKDETYIEPQGYLAITSAESPLSLANLGGKAVLYDDTYALVDEISYLSAQAGVAWSKNTGGVWEWTSSPTYESVNIISPVTQPQTKQTIANTSSTSKKPKPSTVTTKYKSNTSIAMPIQINEIYPDPDSPQSDANDEFIELLIHTRMQLILLITLL